MAQHAAWHSATVSTIPHVRVQAWWRGVRLRVLLAPLRRAWRALQDDRRRLDALAAATIARFYRGWQANPTAGWPEIRKLAQQFE